MILLFLFSVGLELALKCLRDKKYERIEDACKEELKNFNNILIRKMLTLNLLATFSVLRGDFDIGAKYLTTIIQTPGVTNKV